MKLSSHTNWQAGPQNFIKNLATGQLDEFMRPCIQTLRFSTHGHANLYQGSREVNQTLQYSSVFVFWSDLLYGKKN